MRTRALVGIAAGLALLLAACGGASSGGSAPSADPQGRTLTVLAAASLTETFIALAKQFETDHKCGFWRSLKDAPAS